MVIYFPSSSRGPRPCTGQLAHILGSRTPTGDRREEAPEPGWGCSRRHADTSDTAPLGHPCRGSEVALALPLSRWSLQEPRPLLPGDKHRLQHWAKGARRQPSSRHVQQGRLGQEQRPCPPPPPPDHTGLAWNAAPSQLPKAAGPDTRCGTRVPPEGTRGQAPRSPPARSRLCPRPATHPSVSGTAASGWGSRGLRASQARQVVGWGSPGRSKRDQSPS